MRNVLADLAVESEAATIVAMRMAGATDAATRGDDRETLLRRIGLAAAKYWVCKRATPHAGEAMECLGGNGYAEDSGMPRLYREAPLMGIWEGSGNVSALDTLRAMATRPECVDVLFDELGTHRRARRRGSTPTSRALRDGLGDPETSSTGPARWPRTSAWRCRVRCWCATAIPPSPRRSGHPDGRRLGRRVRHAARRPGSGADHRARDWSRDESRTDTHDTMTYEVTDRVARITLQPAGEGQRDHRRHPAGARRAGRARRPRSRRARHPGVRAGRGVLRRFRPRAYAEGSSSAGDGSARAGTVLDGRTQAVNHLPDQPWDPMIDYQMMSRFVRGFPA